MLVVVTHLYYHSVSIQACVRILQGHYRSLVKYIELKIYIF